MKPQGLCTYRGGFAKALYIHEGGFMGTLQRSHMKGASQSLCGGFMNLVGAS